jgi:hypothetical protein
VIWRPFSSARRANVCRKECQLRWCSGDASAATASRTCVRPHAYARPRLHTARLIGTWSTGPTRSSILGPVLENLANRGEVDVTEARRTFERVIEEHLPEREKWLAKHTTHWAAFTFPLLK